MDRLNFGINTMKQVTVSYLAERWMDIEEQGPIDIPRRMFSKVGFVPTEISINYFLNNKKNSPDKIQFFLTLHTKPDWVDAEYRNGLRRKRT